MPEVAWVEEDEATYTVSDKYSDEEVKEMIRLRYEESVTYREIAERFDCHRNTVQNIFNRLNN